MYVTGAVEVAAPFSSGTGGSAVPVDPSDKALVWTGTASRSHKRKNKKKREKRKNRKKRKKRKNRKKREKRKKRKKKCHFVVLSHTLPHLPWRCMRPQLVYSKICCCCRSHDIVMKIRFSTNE
jgi:hypothetical protein